MHGQGVVTNVCDKPAADGTVVATALVVLSDFKERLELPWAEAQELLVAPPGAAAYLRGGLGLTPYVYIRMALICCLLLHLRVCTLTGFAACMRRL